MMLLSCDSKYNPNLILQYGYDYDFLGQLISADYANQNLEDESYTYDSNGNEYTTGTNNELTSDGAWSYTYDDEGNRLTKTNSTNRELYTWDYRNRLTSVTQQEWDSTTETWTTTQTIEYTYDYNNVWIRKILDSNGDGTADSKTIFIPENYQTVTQIDNNTITHHYLWTPNTQDKLLADVTTNDVLWALTDHLGTIRDIVGNSTIHLIYDAFGNIISCKNSAGEMVNNPLLFAYTGKAFDTSTALQNNINRWYDSTTGRWLSTDPIGFNGGDTNLYRYVENRSPLFHDPKGLEPPFYIDPGLQIAQKNREQQDLRISQQPTEEKWEDPNNHWNDDCIVLGESRWWESKPKVLLRIKADVAKQKKVLNKMFQALKDCKCSQNLSNEKYEFAVSKLKAIIKKAQSIPIPQVIDSCGVWVDKASLYVNIPGVLNSHMIRFGTLLAGHAAYKVTICDKTVFYLDNGWWNHVSEANHWFYWTVEEAQI